MVDSRSLYGAELEIVGLVHVVADCQTPAEGVLFTIERWSSPDDGVRDRGHNAR